MNKKKKHAQFQTKTNKYFSTFSQNLLVVIEPYLVSLKDGQPDDADLSTPYTRTTYYSLFSAWELQDLLNRVVKKSYEMDDVFHLETCRALVALSDEDKSGRLNFDEFKQIWLGVRSWIETFLKFDQGTFNIIFGFHHPYSRPVWTFSPETLVVSKEELSPNIFWTP